MRVALFGRKKVDDSFFEIFGRKFLRLEAQTKYLDHHKDDHRDVGSSFVVRGRKR